MDAAAAWLARLQAPGCTAAEREAFERWRAEDARHASSFADVERIHESAAARKHNPLLIAAARSARRRTGARATRRRTVRRLAVPAVAAALLVVMGLHYALVNRGAVDHYATAIGEQRTFHLSDGTELLLDTDSSLTVRYSAKQREITLEHGRAEFDVTHIPGRPFVVRAGDGVILDIGTNFQVGYEEGIAKVTLFEGDVSVSLPAHHWSTNLRPGQQVSYRASGPSAVQTVDPSVARSWTTGDLVFRDRPLDELVEEMNRYSKTKICLGDARLRNILVTGVFHAGDQKSLIQALQVGWSTQATYGPAGEIVLHAPVNR